MKHTAISERAKEEISSIRVGSSCKVVLVTPEHIPMIWDHVIPLLETSQNEQRELSVDDFLEYLMTGDMHLWVAMEKEEVIACMISQFATYPQ